MNFLKEQSLKKLSLYLLAGLVLVFLIEFFILRNKIESLEEIEEKKDYARSTQIKGQELAYMVHLDLHGEKGLKDKIFAQVNEVDHKIDLLGSGGRIEGSNIFLKPLSLLPQITYDNLSENWKEYRINILKNIIGEKEASSPADPILPEKDSLQMSISDNGSRNENMEAILPGQWLTLSKWFEKLLVDLTEEAGVKKNSVEKWFLFFAVLDLALLCSLFFLFLRYVLKPLNRIKANTADRHQEFYSEKNELGDLRSEINVILEQLKDATEFVGAIAEGKLDFDYRTLDNEYVGGKNKLADSLISMQQKLKTLNEEEQRRQWANEGLTKFVDILRSSNDNIGALGDKIISALVKYTNANQGGLYVLNDDNENDRHLELISLFAFDIRKYQTQKLKPGEGILGQTFLEKETTVLNEIPEEYIKITSGLGGANPKSLLIVPLKVDREVYGIVELASFKNFQPHEIAFVEKLAETIASTLASVKVAQKNRNLIEQFQQQSEEMRAQEEEMRQNMEELQATQEELSRKEQDYIVQIENLEKAAKTSVTAAELESIKADFQRELAGAERKLKEMEGRLGQQPLRADDWALAEEVEKTLRMQLESMRITGEELNQNP